MEAMDEQIANSDTPEVLAAMVQLAQLSQELQPRVEQAMEGTADKILQCLIMLSQAHRGAVLLAAQSLSLSRQSSFEIRRMLRHFASSEMSEEEALVFLAHFTLDDVDLQILPIEPDVLICKLPVSVPLSYSSEQEADHLGSRTFPHFAFLILQWEDGNSQQALIAKAQTVLPLVADGAGSAILNALQAERVHELETLSDRKALREMEMLKAELLATVSHELRSPLASIKGYAATLLRHERRISREERHDFLLAINEASDRLEVIIDRLLEVSQLATGGIEMEFSTVNLVHLVRESIIGMEKSRGDSLWQEQREDGKLPISFHVRVLDIRGLPTTDDPIIEADRFRLREVLDNLLENAILYSPVGGEIEVVLRPVFEQVHPNQEHKLSQQYDHRNRPIKEVSSKLGRPMVEICIRDHGIGIPPGQLKAIFDRFHRVDTRLTREVNGLGLGLAICKRIVELHDGRIWAESEYGKGSSFYIVLPVNPKKHH